MCIVCFKIIGATRMTKGVISRQKLRNYIQWRRLARILNSNGVIGGNYYYERLDKVNGSSELILWKLWTNFH